MIPSTHDSGLSDRRWRDCVPCHCWRTLFAASKWHATEARRLSLAGIQASWLPESRKCELRREFEATLAAIETALDPVDRALDLAIERLLPQWRRALTHPGHFIRFELPPAGFSLSALPPQASGFQCSSCFRAHHSIARAGTTDSREVRHLPLDIVCADTKMRAGILPPARMHAELRRIRLIVRGHHASRCTLSDIRSPHPPYRVSAMAECHARCYHPGAGSDVSGDDHANCVQAVDIGRGGFCSSRASRLPMLRSPSGSGFWSR